MSATAFDMCSSMEALHSTTSQNDAGVTATWLCNSLGISTSARDARSLNLSSPIADCHAFNQVGFSCLLLPLADLAF